MTRDSLIPALGLLILAAAPSLPAQSAPAEITIQGERGYPVLLTQLSGAAGSDASAIVQADLTRSGVIRFQSQPNGAFVVQGLAESDRLEGRVVAPDGRVLFNRAYRGDSVERLSHQFSDDVIRAITGKPSIANSRIGFVSDRTGKKEIYLCDADGGNVRQVTRDASISVSPALSPDGRKLAYTGYLTGYADVYLIDLPTGKRDRVIAEPGTNTGAAISPGGDRLALTMSAFGNPELVVTPITGGKAKRLTQSKAVESSPTWSPDGRQLIYVSDSSGKPQLYRIDANGGRPQLLSLGLAYCVEPDWSPDGARLAFNVRQEGRNRVAMHDFQLNVTKTLTSGENAENPIWGPDSRHLIYVQSNTLYLHDVESGVRTPIVSAFGNISEPTWTR